MLVNMLEAKSRLSSLVAAAEQGEDVVLARNGVPVAKIVKYVAPKVRSPGAWRDQVAYADDWDSPATNAEVAHLLPGAD